MKVILQILCLYLLIQCILCKPPRKCPDGWKDEYGDGHICTPPNTTYGRGGGYAWQFGDKLNLNGARKRCEKDHPELGCEKNGAVIYPKCKPYYKEDGCCFCKAVDCPEGYKKLEIVPFGFVDYCSYWV